MNCKCLCVYPYVRYCANRVPNATCVPHREVICTGLSDNISTQNSRLHVFVNMNVPLLVWMPVCKCMHISCVIGDCAKRACNFPEFLCPVLLCHNCCRAAVYANHRVVASHFAYWVSCYPGQLCWRKHELVLHTKTHGDAAETQCPHQQPRIYTHTHVRINTRHSSCHMPTHACVKEEMVLSIPARN